MNEIQMTIQQRNERGFGMLRLAQRAGACTEGQYTKVVQ